MKHFILSLFLFCITSVVFGQNQILKLRTSHYSEKHILENGDWNNFSPWSESNCLILVETNRITIFSEVKQVYDVINIISDKEDYESSISTYTCLNERGKVCKMTFTHLKENGIVENSFLHVDFRDVTLMYKIYKLD